MKSVAQEIFRQTLAALDVRAAMDRTLARRGSLISAGVATIDLSNFSEIVVVAFGKAALAMAEALIDILAPDYACDGILVTPTPPATNPKGWHTFVGGHPVPNAESFAAGHAILDRLAVCDEHSLIIFLLSGGGSALVESPLDPRASLDDFQKLNALLVGCGAPIEQINAVRKHFSGIKGGRLAAAAPRSTKLTLAISDVPPGQESALASGPTLPDPTTLEDAAQVLRDNGLLEKLPAPLREAIQNHALPETPKQGDAAFARAHFSLILGSHDLTHAAHRACEAHGYTCVCDVMTDGWSIEKAADHLLALLAQHKRENRGRHVAVVADGEVSSPVRGNGIGGRNSAFVLACVPKITGQSITVLSAGTDGIDGNSPAAGAFADGKTPARAREAGLDAADFLARSDAYHFFDKLGDAIITGPTGNNLRDLRILLAEPD